MRARAVAAAREGAQLVVLPARAAHGRKVDRDRAPGPQPHRARVPLENVLRLVRRSCGAVDVDAGAVELCARKIALENGDARRALNVIRSVR